MRQRVDLEGCSTGELVEVVHGALGLLACRTVPDSPVACLELAERLGAGLDLGEAALARLVAVADRAGEPSALRYPGTRGWLKSVLGMRTGRANERLLVARQLGRLWFGLRVPVWPLQDACVSARLADGTPIAAEQARIIALNAGVSLLLLGADGVPLYLGRRTRFVTSGQRQVLEALYETCAFTECDIPARFCEADHVLNWTDGGTTDIDMLAPCCGWHNRVKYEHPDWVTSTRETDGRWRHTLRRPDRALNATRTPRAP